MGIVSNHKLNPKREVNRCISLYCKNCKFNLNLRETNPNEQEIAFTFMCKSQIASTLVWHGCQHKLVKFIKLKLTCDVWLAPGFVLVLYLKKVQRLLKQCFFALLQLDNSFIKDRQITALSLCCRNLQQDKKCKVMQTGFKKKGIGWKWPTGKIKSRGKYFEENTHPWYNCVSPIYADKVFI